MKFIKRFFAKKYTQDEVNAILAKLHDDNLVRMNAITDKALAESDRLFIEWQEKSRLEREAINTQFSKSLEDYQLKPFEVETVKVPPYNGNYPMLHRAKAMQDAAKAIDPYANFR